ncbi:hypothetical protein [Bacillus altitudinis]|uniref:hypothetical protein n=1 Tax=Bacillus altitudinis TaxID=293387 RepID=UPI003CF76651
MRSNGLTVGGFGQSPKESLGNQCPLMHLKVARVFSLRSKQNARHCTVGIKESKMVRLKKYLCGCFVWRRCERKTTTVVEWQRKANHREPNENPPQLTGGYYGRKEQIEASHSNGLTRFEFVTKFYLND